MTVYVSYGGWAVVGGNGRTGCNLRLTLTDKQNLAQVMTGNPTGADLFCGAPFGVDSLVAGVLTWHSTGSWKHVTPCVVKGIASEHKMTLTVTDVAGKVLATYTIPSGATTDHYSFDVEQ